MLAQTKRRLYFILSYHPNGMPMPTVLEGGPFQNGFYMPNKDASPMLCNIQIERCGQDHVIYEPILYIEGFGHCSWESLGCLMTKKWYATDRNPE